MSLCMQSRSECPSPDWFKIKETATNELPIKPRYSFSEDHSPILYTELRHGKSDDLILQNAPLFEPEMHSGISDDSILIKRESCVVFDDTPISSRNSTLLSSYCSDGEIDSINNSNYSNKQCSLSSIDKQTKSLDTRQTVLPDHIDAENSVRDIMTENDFYRFVLFKRHYKKYIDISKKFEVAKSMTYYWEEKYYEIKSEQENVARKQKELEEKVDLRESELNDKEQELFMQLERVVKLEEESEKIKTEKEQLLQLTDQLQKEKDQLYRQLKLHTDSTEAMRHKLELARQNVLSKMTQVAEEKDKFEEENFRLKEILGDLEGKMPNTLNNLPWKRTLRELEEEVSELKHIAKQSASLNSQLKKGMTHLATCRRRKCAVCAYTRTTFEQLSTKRRKGGKLLSGCFTFYEGRDYADNDKLKMRAHYCDDPCIELAARASRFSYTFSNIPPSLLLPHINYIDKCTSSSMVSDADMLANNEDNDSVSEECKDSVDSSVRQASHTLSSDSGLSSVLYDTLPRSEMKQNSFNRKSNWTSSFRKLFRRISLKRQSTPDNKFAAVDN